MAGNCPGGKRAQDKQPEKTFPGCLNSLWYLEAGSNGREIALDEIAYSLQLIKGYSASKVGSIGA